MLESYIAFDLETTGLDPMNNEIIEIGALKVRDGKVSERFMEFIKPQELISPAITGLTGISNDMVASARPARSVITDFIDFCEEDILIGHNIIFDYSFTKCTAAREGLPFEKMGIDTLKIAKKVHPELESKSLSALCEHYKIENKAAHRAYFDALATAKLYQTLSHYFEPDNPKTFKPTQLTYKIRKPQPATPKQLALLERRTKNKKTFSHNTEAFSCNAEALSYNPETLSRSDASRLIDRLLKGN